MQAKAAIDKVFEAKNHMGEQEFQTYPAWKRKIKQICPDARFDGDRDICAAVTPEGKGIGEWDGATGCIYNKK
jgi:hypothetical protein